MQIPIYKNEVNDGLRDQFKENFVAFSSKIEISNVQIDEDSKKLIRTEAEEQFDLYPISTILVSIGWNDNDDIFEKYETWAARKTPVHKPLNVNHDHSKIRGHIAACSVIDREGNIIDDDTVFEDVPDFFHILTSAFLYRAWKPEEIQKEIDTIIAEINNGEWCVSMEAWFKGFDYGIIDLDGTHKIIERNEATSFLTKHLKRYGGTGEYQGRKIGRLLRDITFSGKGLTKNPANPYSIIVAEKFEKTIASIDELGDEMKPEEIDALKAEKATLEAKITSYETVEKSLKSTAASLETEKKDLVDKLTKSEASKVEADNKVKELEKANKELTDKVVTLTESNKTVTDELSKIRAEAKTAARLASVKEKNKTVNAEELIKKFETLDDAAFAAIVELIPVEKTEPVAPPVATAGKNKELEQEVVPAVVTAPVENAEASTIGELAAYFKSTLQASK